MLDEGSQQPLFEQGVQTPTTVDPGADERVFRSPGVGAGPLLVPTGGFACVVERMV